MCALGTSYGKTNVTWEIDGLGAHDQSASFIVWECNTRTRNWGTNRATGRGRRRVRDVQEVSAAATFTAKLSSEREDSVPAFSHRLASSRQLKWTTLASITRTATITFCTVTPCALLNRFRLLRASCSRLSKRSCWLALLLIRLNRGVWQRRRYHWFRIRDNINVTVASLAKMI